MPSPSKVRPGARRSDRQELENLLRVAAELFRTNRPKRIRELSAKKFSTATYAAVQRCGQ